MNNVRSEVPSCPMPQCARDIFASCAGVEPTFADGLLGYKPNCAEEEARHWIRLRQCEVLARRWPDQPPMRSFCPESCSPPSAEKAAQEIFGLPGRGSRGPAQTARNLGAKLPSRELIDPVAKRYFYFLKHHYSRGLEMPDPRNRVPQDVIGFWTHFGVA